MKLSVLARLAALEAIKEQADVPSGLTWFYPEPGAPIEVQEYADRARRAMAVAMYPGFDPDTGEPLNDEARALLVRRL